MQQPWFQKHIDTLCTTYGYAQDSVLLTVERFDPALKNLAIERATAQHNTGQLKIFLCFSKLLSLNLLHALPKGLARDPAVRSFWKDAWIENTRRNAATPEGRLGAVPDRLKVLLSKEWLIRHAQRGVDKIVQLPEQISSRAEIQHARKKIWLAHLSGKLRTEVLNAFPEDLLADKNTTKRYARAWASVSRALVLAGHDSKGHWPSVLLKDPFLLRARRRDWLDYLQTRRVLALPSDTCPPKDLQGDRKIQKAWQETWTSALQSDPLDATPPKQPFAELPVSLQEDAEILGLWAKQWERWLLHKPDFTQIPLLPTPLQTREEVIRAFARSLTTAYLQAALPEARMCTFLDGLGLLETGTGDSRLWDQLHAPEHNSQDATKTNSPAGRAKAALDHMAWVEGCCKSAWMPRLKERGFEIHSIPAILSSDSEIRTVWCESWIQWLATCGSSRPDFFRLVPRLLQQEPSVQAWLEGTWVQSVISHQKPLWECPLQYLDNILVQRHFSRLDLLPEKLRNAPQFLPAWKQLLAFQEETLTLLEFVGSQPALTPALADLWRHSPDPKKQDAANAMRLLRERPWNFGQLSVSAQAHPVLLTMAGTAMLRLLKASDAYRPLLCPAFKALPAMREYEKAHRAALKKERCKERLLMRQKLVQERRALLRNWAKRIRANAREYAVVPCELRMEPQILSALRKTLGPLIQRSPQTWETLPAALREDHGLQNVYRIATRDRESLPEKCPTLGSQEGLSRDPAEAEGTVHVSASLHPS